MTSFMAFKMSYSSVGLTAHVASCVTEVGHRNNNPSFPISPDKIANNIIINAIHAEPHD